MAGLEAYDYPLPPELIAQEGVEPRDLARMLVVYREGPFRVAHKRVRDLPEFLRPGDVLVFNESKVIPARLLARKPTGGRVEALLVRERAPGLWEALLGPARRAPVGTELSFLSPKDLKPVPGLKAVVVGVEEDGVRLLQIQGDLMAHLEEVGEVPLPPYIKARIPLERYQTVYAKRPGSVAAPTAGLHFTPELLGRLREMGVELHFLASPVRFLGTNKVEAVEFIRNRLGEPDATGRPRPVPIPGSEFTVEADTVVLAIGQRPDISWLGDQLPIRNGYPQVDPETLMVEGHPGLFACGDFVTGSSTIVAAMAQGRRAAASVHRYLGGEPRPLSPRTAQLAGTLYPKIYEGPNFARPQPRVPKAEPNVRRQRLSLEVEMTYSEEAVRLEASRCLYCGLPVQIRPEDCIMCDACVAVCPVNCIHPAVTAEVGGPRWTDSVVEATTYRIDQEACIRCGRCLKVCPTRAIFVGP